MNGPLDGVRVLDFGIVGTGPKTALILAWLGADVIKIESPRFPDPFRFAAMFPAGSEGNGEPWNMSVGANANSRHKRSVCLDYLHPEGARAVDRLIRNSDVLLHNFRMAVADKARLDWTRVSALNPRMILAALSSQGDSGPRRDYGSYGATLEGLGGIAGLVGDDDAPLTTSVNFPDQACPLLASGAIISCLLERDHTGSGAFIDFAQVEATALLAGAATVTSQMPGYEDSDFSAESDEPTGVFPCAGDDDWIALETTDDATWASLRQVLSLPGDDHPTRLSRVTNKTSLHQTVSDWTVLRDASEVERTLRAAGIPVARVLRGPDVLVQPQLEVRDYFEDLVSPALGPGRYNGNPLGQSLRPAAWAGRSAASMGRDNREVLVEVAGMTHGDVDRLVQLGVLAQRPSGGGGD